MAGMGSVWDSGDSRDLNDTGYDQVGTIDASGGLSDDLGGGA